jgi:hypothetical protein
MLTERTEMLKLSKGLLALSEAFSVVMDPEGTREGGLHHRAYPRQHQTRAKKEPKTTTKAADS